MKARRQSERSCRQGGSALLIAIFALLLISVVGIALLISTGADSALAGNYRTSTGAYYAAAAGLEEARGRLLWKNPDFINKSGTYPTLFTGQGTSFGLTDVLYILNPAASETVDPANSSSKYADAEYGTEFSWLLSGANVQTPVTSDSAVAGIPGPLYKWVRMNAITEKALKMDVNADGTYDQVTPLYYDGTGLNLNSSGVQALEITAFAYMPDNSTKLLQYVVVPNSLNFNFPAALTVIGSPGNDVQFMGPGTPDFKINGNDNFAVGSCAPGPTPGYAIGYAGGGGSSGITATPAANYQGVGGSSTVPSVSPVSISGFPASFQTPAALNALVQNIEQTADAVLTPVSPQPAVYGGNLPAAMSISNPMTIVVNGDLDLTSWHGIGYGLLIVTGNFTYDPDATWNGVVLVIGEGNFVSTKGGTNQFNGAMLLAKTTTGGSPLSTFGAASFSQTGGSPSGYGIYYSSCWVKTALAPTSYRVLSFREITPP